MTNRTREELSLSKILLLITFIPFQPKKIYEVHRCWLLLAWWIAMRVCPGYGLSTVVCVICCFHFRIDHEAAIWHRFICRSSIFSNQQRLCTKSYNPSSWLWTISWRRWQWTLRFWQSWKSPTFVSTFLSKINETNNKLKEQLKWVS